MYLSQCLPYSFSKLWKIQLILILYKIYIPPNCMVMYSKSASDFLFILFLSRTTSFQPPPQQYTLLSSEVFAKIVRQHFSKVLVI